MSVTDQSPLLQSLQLQEELRTAVDERTLQILDRRRRTAVVKRRGWLVRRMLLACRRGRSRRSALCWRNGSRPPSTSADAYSPGRGDPRLPAHDSGMGGDHEALRPLRPRRRARQPLDRRRLRRRLPHGHRLHLARHCGHVSERHRASDRAKARRLLGLPRSRSSVSPGPGRGRLHAGTRPTSRTPSSSVRATSASCSRRRSSTTRSTGSISSASSTPSPRTADRTSSMWRCSAIRSRLPAIVRLLDVERVIVAFSNDSHEETLELLRSVKDLEVQIDIVPRLFEFVGPGVEIHTDRGSPARRVAAPAALAVVPPAEAGDGSRAHDSHARRPRTCLCTARADDQDRLSGPRLLSGRSEWAPPAAPSGSSSSARCTRTRKSGSTRSHT